MATIAELIVAGRFDADGITQGLNDATGKFRTFSTELGTSVNAQIGAFERLAKTIDVTSAESVRGFRLVGDALAANLVSLGATDAELNRIGSTLQRIERTAGATALEGILGGGGGAGGMAAASNIGRALGVMRTETESLGRASTSTVVGIGELARGLSRVAETGTVGTFAIREFSGAAMRLGSVFGEWGIYIAIIGMLGHAVYELFNSSRKQMEETRKKFEEELNRMMDDFDQLGMIRKVRQLEMGSPSAGVGEGGAYVGGILDIQARITEAQSKLLEGLRKGDQNIMSDQQKELRNLRNQLQPLIEERAKLVAAILNPVVLPGFGRDISGLQSMKITANTPAKQATEDQKEFASAIRRTTSEATGLTSVLGNMFKLHQNTAQIAGVIDTTYANLQRELASLKDPLGAQLDLWISIRKAMEDIEKTKYFQMLSKAGLTGVGNLAMPTSVAAGPVPAAPPIDVGSLSFMRTLQLGLEDILGSIGSALTSELSAMFGPVALAFKVLEPGLRIIDALFDKLLAPLAAVVEVIATGLEPVFRLLFPIIRDIAIALTYLQEIIDRVASVIARLVGNVVVAIGALIAHIPFLGGVGRRIEDAGKSILNYSDELKKNADQLVHVRDRLEHMQFGQTADAIAGLGDAAAQAAEELSNVPTGFKATLDYLRYLVQGAVGPGGVVNPLLSPAGAGGLVVNGDVIVSAQTMSAQEIYAKVKSEAQVRALSQTGNTARAAETFNT